MNQFSLQNQLLEVDLKFEGLIFMFLHPGQGSNGLMAHLRHHSVSSPGHEIGHVFGANHDPGNQVLVPGLA